MTHKPNNVSAAGVLTKEAMVDAYTKAVGFAPAAMPYWLHAFADNIVAAASAQAMWQAVQEPVAWMIDPGAGSATDRFQQVEPYGWQYAEVEKRGGSITPLYAAPAAREAGDGVRLTGPKTIAEVWDALERLKTDPALLKQMREAGSR